LQKDGVCAAKISGQHCQPTRQYVDEPPPQKSVILRPLKQAASYKSSGPDGVPAELLKEGGDITIDRIHKVWEMVWETEEWPNDWTNSTFLELPKKVT